MFEIQVNYCKKFERKQKMPTVSAQFELDLPYSKLHTIY